MEVLFWLGGSLLWLFLYRNCRDLGLLDSTPRDPKARAASHGFAALALLKEELCGAHVLSWESNFVQYQRNSTMRELRGMDATLRLRNGSEERHLPLGEGGRCVFCLVQTQMTVDILVTDADDVVHTNSVSIPIALEELVSGAT